MGLVGQKKREETCVTPKSSLSRTKSDRETYIRSNVIVMMHLSSSSSGSKGRHVLILSSKFCWRGSFSVLLCVDCGTVENKKALLSRENSLLVAVLLVVVVDVR